MRLWLSEKAQKALDEVPEAMKGLDPAKAAEPATPEAREEKRRAEEAAREAKKEAKKDLREATTRADEGLHEALAAAEAADRKVHDLDFRLAERRKDARHGAQAVADAERRLADAQAALERAKKEHARAEAEVPTLEAELEAERTRLGTTKEALQQALGEADAAWRTVHPRNRKKRDRRPRHAAIQLLGIRKDAAGEGENGEAEGDAGAE